MVLKVDLQGCSCYKKVKKILCKFPEIRDQEYDEKGNRVTITVVCCNPEKLRDKLCCKGCGVITSIEIIQPKVTPPPVTPPVTPPPPPPPPPEPVIIVIPVTIQAPPAGYCCRQCYGSYGYSYGYGCSYGCSKGCNVRSRCDH